MCPAELCSGQLVLSGPVCFWGLVDNAYVVYLYGDGYEYVSLPGVHMHAVYQSTGMTRCEEKWTRRLGLSTMSVVLALPCTVYRPV